ncbi:MAG: hypothetical protein IKF47_03230 [Bacilli bacterium]|nr:hypothetical protein [Bacilli bacterium]
MRKYMLLLISVLLTFVTSVAYSALSTSLAISSEVKFRPLADIRINEIALAGASGGQLAYESVFSKNTVSTGFTLPTPGASISYRVRVDNSGDVDYSRYWAGGGGGSGYIGGVTSASTTNGQRFGHGYATISWVG